MLSYLVTSNSQTTDVTVRFFYHFSIKVFTIDLYLILIFRSACRRVVTAAVLEIKFCFVQSFVYFGDHNNT